MASQGRLRVQVLGPLRLLDGSEADLTPDGPLQRRLLALLVLHRDEVVAADVAIEALWPVRPPEAPGPALQNHVSRLRRRLPDGIVESVGDGYRLAASAVDVDADRLGWLVAAGIEDPALAAELASLLGGWSGPAYPDLLDVDDGRAESMRLEELRVRAREVQAERRLAVDDTDGLVAELGALVHAEPLRERPRGLLMSALAATGRRVEALRVFDDFRRQLGDELGIEPSPVLVAQHTALLTAGDTTWRPASRLPAPATSLVGRDALVAELTTTLAAQRLVTLVGPGGVGKTRLATEVARSSIDANREQSVAWCELALGSGETALDVVAAALSIDVRPGVTVAERVASVLGESEVLLVLDNCEHVLGPIAALVATLLERCPNLRLLATSRERLRVPGEHVRSVPPLVPDDETSPPVALFVDRARAVAPGFDPGPAELAAIVEIVRRLDGLPLAIELAAARLHVHDLAEVVDGLDSRFALLAAGYRTSARHGSLHAVVAWSFGLLDPSLQQTFTDLSAFVGPFTVADAATVCATDLPTASTQVVELAERSLVVRGPDGRFSMLETLRAFAADELDPSGRADLVAERHARWCVDRAEGAEARLHEPGPPVLVELDDAIPELHAALDWLLDRGHADLAGRLVAALVNPMVFRLRPDVLSWADRVLALDLDDRDPLTSRLWAASAYAAWMVGDLDALDVRSSTAVEIGEADPSRVPQVAATIRADHDLFDGRLDSAAAWYRRGAAVGENDAQRLMAAGGELLALGYAGASEAPTLAVALLEDVGDLVTPTAAYIWYCAGEAMLDSDVDLALERLVRAVELAEATSASFPLGLAGATKASIEARVGDPAVAAADYQWLIPHWQRSGMWSTQWTMLRSIVGLLARLGRHRDAAVLEGAIRSTDSGHRLFGADEVALREAGDGLRAALGDAAYRAALDEGAALDDDAVLAHVLRSL